MTAHHCDGVKKTTGIATCKICLDALVRRPENERRNEEYKRRQVEREAQREAESKEWNDWYQSYLRRPQWAARRQRVLARAGSVCESCLVTRATEVHHTTYAHVGNEPLWELRAICRDCHEQITQLDREKRSPA